MKATTHTRRILSLLILLVLAVGIIQEQRGKPQDTDPIKAFVKVEVSKHSLHVKDTLSISYKLYSTEDVDRVLQASFPHSNGFQIRQVRPSQQVEKVTIDDVEYQVVELRKDILIPKRTGKWEFSEGVLLLEYSIPTGRQMRDFWGDIREEVRRYRKEVSIDAITVTVHDLIAV